MRVIGADTETYLLASGVASPKLVCGSYDDDDFEIGVELADDFFDRFWSWLIDPTVVITFHHAPFDLGVLCAEAYERGRGLEMLRAVFKAIKERRIRCTKIRDQILENARGELKFDFDEDLGEFRRSAFTLERCVWNRLKDEDGRRLFVNKSADTWRKRYGLLDGVPIDEWPEDAVKYALKDAALDRRLFFAQEEAAVAEDCPIHADGLADIPGEVATTLVAFCLDLMRIWGVRTDAAMVDVVRAEFQEKFDAAAALARKWELVGTKKVSEVLPEYEDSHGHLTEKEIKKLPASMKHRVVRPKRDMKRIKDRVRYFYVKNGAEIPMSDSGKNISTDRETLTFKRHPSWEKDEGLQAVADVVRYEKLLKTYVPILRRGAKFPITPDWNAMVETFRVSCARPNLTNQPRGTKVRECFIPRPGWVFVESDYSTLEGRTFAQTCIKLFGYSVMADAFRDDKDVHLVMTANTLEMDYEEAKRRYDLNDKVIENARQYSKIAVYGMLGGMGPDAFMDYARGYDIVVDRPHAVQLHQDFRRSFPEAVDYFNYCSSLCTDGGEVETLVDVITGYVRGRVRYTAACNNGFQHPAAVGAKAALSRTIEEAYTMSSSPLYGCRPVVFSHDSIMMEVPLHEIGRERASAAAEHLSRVMIEEMQVICPDVPIKTDTAMFRRWTKGAKPVYVDGLLVPSRKEGKSWVADLDERRAA